jgi:hypothetical protein
MTDDARRRIEQLRAAGYGWHTVAATLNDEGVPTVTGQGRWHASTCWRTEPEHRARYNAWAHRARLYGRAR